jgi:hypothetical protein
MQSSFISDEDLYPSTDDPGSFIPPGSGWSGTHRSPILTEAPPMPGPLKPVLPPRIPVDRERRNRHREMHRRQQTKLRHMNENLGTVSEAAAEDGEGQDLSAGCAVQAIHIKPRV